jgi:hypothetical protein
MYCPTWMGHEGNNGGWSNHGWFQI